MVKPSTRLRRTLATVVVLSTGALAAPPAQAQVNPPIPPGHYTQVSVDIAYACAVRTDNAVVCFGHHLQDAAHGGVADPGLLSPPAGSYRTVSAGNNSVCALRLDSTLACWGNGDHGETNPPPGTYTQVSTGNIYACAIRPDQTLACWGAVRPPPPGTFSSFDASGVGPACMIATDLSLTCEQLLPAVPPGSYLQVSHRFAPGTFGDSATCAIGTDHALVCVGAPDRAAAPAGTFSSVSVGTTLACAIRTDQTLACWGRGMDTNHTFNGAPPPPGRFVSVGVGQDFACAVRVDGVLLCWPGGLSSEPDGGLPVAFGPHGVFSLPSNRACVSRRHFRIRVRRQRGGVTLVSAAVAVNGRRVAVRKGKRLTAPVDLRGLPKGRFTVRISALTSDARAITGIRRYRTCAPRRASNGPGPV